MSVIVVDFNNAASAGSVDDNYDDDDGIARVSIISL